jgi:hypothetical protein
MTTLLELVARAIQSRELWPQVCGVVTSDIRLFCELYSGSKTDGISRCCIEDLIWKMYYDSTRYIQPGIMDRIFQMEPQLSFLNDMYFGEWMIIGEFVEFLLGLRNNYSKIDIMVWRLYRIPNHLGFQKVKPDYSVRVGNKNIWLFQAKFINCHNCHNVFPYVGILKGDFIYNFKYTRNVLSLQAMALKSLAQSIQTSNTKNHTNVIPLNSAIETVSVSSTQALQVNQQSFNFLQHNTEVIELICPLTKPFVSCTNELCGFFNSEIASFCFTKIGRKIKVFLNEKHVATILDYYGRMVLIANKSSSYCIRGYDVDSIYQLKSWSDFNKIYK